MIPYGRQSIDEDDITAVTSVLRSPWLTQGPAVIRLEEALVEYTGAEYAVSVSSATAALHVSCLALGLGAGDVLWTSANSFVASSNCALYVGAEVDFIDIDPVTRNICITALEDKLALAKLKGKLPKIIVAVHFAGLSCDMAKIRALADAYNVYLLEDASHALGSEYQGKKVGGCHYSDITVFSFHPVKNIAAGEGGAVLTNDICLANKVRQFACHGITKNAADFVQVDDSPCRYEQQNLGFNYRLSDIHSALAAQQLVKLDHFRELRANHVARYNRAFLDDALQIPITTSDKVAWHIYVVTFEHREVRDACFERLKAADIYANIHYIPIPSQPFYQGKGFNVADYPNTLAHYQRSLTLPLFVDLTESEQQLVIDTVKAAL